MQVLDSRDRELLSALERDLPLSSTPYAIVGQAIDMSEKEVIKRIERLKRDSVISHVGGHFDAHALGYESCLVAATCDEPRIDEAAAVIAAHPGVTQAYRRNNEMNLWFTIFIRPDSNLGLARTIDLLAEEAGFGAVRTLPALKLYKSNGFEGGEPRDETQRCSAPSPEDVVVIRLLQEPLPPQPRPFELLAKSAGIDEELLLSAARSMKSRGLIRHFGAMPVARRSGFTASAMAIWSVGHERIDDAATIVSRSRAVSHCHVRKASEEWPYDLYAVIHARSVDECESITGDLSRDAQLERGLVLFPTREYKHVRLSFFSPEAEAWEAARGGERQMAAI